MSAQKHDYISSLASYVPGKLAFYGCEEAELFSKQIATSLAAVLEKSFVWAPDKPNNRFVTTSVDGRVCSDHLWSRDAGTLLRELAMWGYLGHACFLAEILLDLVDLNAEGYFTYPMFFYQGKKASGDELDGTGSVLIGLALLWKRLAGDHPMRDRIMNFFVTKESPIRYILKKLEKTELIGGTGEFGSGIWDRDEPYCNIVQNNLLRLALEAVATVLADAGYDDLRKQCEQDAKKLKGSILSHMVGEDKGWIWCVHPQTLMPNQEVLENDFVRGFGGINGVLAMISDVHGFDLRDHKCFLEASAKTFDRLLSAPLRKVQFEKYGIWTQFDILAEGLLTSPSYGQGYALQVALLLGRLDIAGELIGYLAKATFSPPYPYRPDRDSPYHFYERMLSPEHPKLAGYDQGCGALNLVNVAEPLKVARVIAGIDDMGEKLQIIPRLPPGWAGYKASNWPVLTEYGIKLYDIACENGSIKSSAV